MAEKNGALERDASRRVALVTGAASTPRPAPATALAAAPRPEPAQEQASHRHGPARDRVLEHDGAR